MSERFTEEQVSPLNSTAETQGDASAMIEVPAGILDQLEAQKAETQATLGAEAAQRVIGMPPGYEASSATQEVQVRREGGRFNRGITVMEPRIMPNDTASQDNESKSDL